MLSFFFFLFFSLFPTNSTLNSQATVTLLENIDILVLKTDKADFRADIVPMFCNAFDSPSAQIQVGAVDTLTLTLTPTTPTTAAAVCFDLCRLKLSC